MERPEAQDAGTIILTGFEPDRVLQSIHFTIKEKELKMIRSIPANYDVDNASQRVLKLILGNAKLNNLWNGTIISFKQ